MQVTSSFATFFALFFLVAPLATQALQITAPTNITTGNATIAFSSEDTDPPGLLTFVLVKNTTRDTIAENVDPTRGHVSVTIPANMTGTGWTIQALTPDDVHVGASPPFSIAAAPKPKSMGGGIVGGVVGGVLVLALIVLGVFLYARRRRQKSGGPQFNIEAGFPPPRHTQDRSLSSMSSGFEDTTDKLELEKMQWEMELESQFARARAGTPDVLRGGSPMPRGTSPLRGSSSMPLAPLAPQRAVTRNTKY